MLEKILKMFGLKVEENLPIWAYGLECGICKMTFTSAKNHADHARKKRTIKKHDGKIPVIRR